MIDDNERVTSWLDQLAARGIAAKLVNNRIRLSPRSAYRRLTHADLTFIYQYGSAIKRALARRISYLEHRS